MKIAFAGCSLTWGAELYDRETVRYSSLVSKVLGANEINIAQPGISNDLICKGIFELSSRINLDFAVIQITSILRFTFVYNNDFVTIVPGIQTYKTDPFLQSIKKHVHSSNTDMSYWYELSRWKLIAIHNHLNALGVKHMFIFMDEADLDLFTNDEVVNNSFKQHCCRPSLLGLCKTESLQLGKFGHPIEEAHKQIAKKIILPKIREML